MTLRLRKRSLFPALVQVTSPILLTKVGSTYTFSFDANAFVGSLPAALQALALVDSTAGLLTQTSTYAFTKRVLTGTANEITVTNGDGVAGNPTWGLPTALTFTGKTVTGGTFSSGTFNNATFNGSTYNNVLITPPAAQVTLTLTTGTTVTGPAASGTLMTLGNAETITGVKTFNDSKLLLAGSVSGTTTLRATGAASGSVTIPAVTDTLIGKATTDTLTNKTLDSAGTGNVLKVSGVTVSAGQYPGTTTNDSATSGNVGEYLSVSLAVGSAVSLTTGTTANVVQQAVAAGDYDVRCGILFLGAGTTNSTFLNAGISTANGTTMPTADGLTATQWSNSAGQVLGSTAISIPTAWTRVSLPSSGTIFGNAQATFTVSTMKAFGMMQIRRVR